MSTVARRQAVHQHDRQDDISAQFSRALDALREQIAWREREIEKLKRKIARTRSAAPAAAVCR